MDPTGLVKVIFFGQPWVATDLKVGDKVITTSGIYGSITKLNDRSVQLQVADKVRIEVSRAAVGGYQGQDPVVQDSGSM